MAQVQQATSIRGKKYNTTVLSQLQIQGLWSSERVSLGSLGFWFLGYFIDNEAGENYRTYLQFRFNIPTDFVVTDARIVLYHYPVYWDNGGDYALWGYCQNIKAYQVTNADNNYVTAAFESEYYYDTSLELSEIAGTFGTSGYTAPDPSVAGNDILNSTTSKNIANYLIEGENFLVVRSSDAIPSYEVDNIDNIEGCAAKTGMAYAVLNIVGYRG